MGNSAPDNRWLAEALLDGDRVAFMEVNRLISSTLRRLNAYGMRGEWTDLHQEVILAVVHAARSGKLRQPEHLPAFVRTVTRNKFVDRLDRHTREQVTQTITWDQVSEMDLRDLGRTDEAHSAEVSDLWMAVRTLPERQQRILRGLYREGKTYRQVSQDTGIPLGTLKRGLQDAITKLRDSLAQTAAVSTGKVGREADEDEM